MRPCLQHRRIVEVRAGIAWEATLNHRVYSCPDIPRFDFVSGATALILQNGQTRARVPLEVVAVERVIPAEHAQIEALAEPFRSRAASYLANAAAIPEIVAPACPHRLYFLSEESWPVWLQRLTATASNTEWTAILSICAEPERFFEWPQVGELLWPGCMRGNGDEPHHYPEEVAERLRRAGFPQPDDRSNGPAIMAFRIAGGRRPMWESEGWPVHHIYDGTAPIIGDPPVVHPEAHGGLHAVQDGRFFTHSGGLVAAHPVAHHLAHQSALMKWLLRREAFLRFRFDPMGVF
jgi:hypothetical protein